MSRWKALPTSLDERAQKLVVQLRWLKDRSGLSLTSLQSKTGYSRSSWERYLNGRALPPREAVEALAHATGVDATRVLVLHEVAAEAWQPVAGTSVEPAVSEPRGVRPAVLIGTGTVVVLGALIAGLLVAAPWKGGSHMDGSTKEAAPASASAAAFVYQPGKTYICPLKRQKGQLYAGHSTARVKVLGQGSQGWDVVEVQCLLQHDGFDPGGVDGVYGANTARAVKLLQKKAGLYTDGVVGLHTWQVLRK
ncbi:helix-turn-helix domain-containing protein [Streptomyces sp. NBC_01571]|uniref:helix-turn-helix domain-containing protein n=1 Tax=Streptomyces sp. NBC_01571 TaxID=2975883 RepID=UPI00225A35E4|nr:helix-turn-helix domain-containing protein [Streptomyces sp. NBC_01571]MCX4581419.1 helix-turn-helix domain-containing protein [Streptomyces sp. NBC_01571]